MSYKESTYDDLLFENQIEVEIDESVVFEGYKLEDFNLQLEQEN